MGTLVALVMLLSCGPPPKNADDCAKRCHGCGPSGVRDRGTFFYDEECAEECNVANDMWVCDVEVGQCVVAWS